MEMSQKSPLPEMLPREILIGGVRPRTIEMANTILGLCGIGIIVAVVILIAKAVK